MSTNKSEHLGLHLWEPEDDFLRTEFNENFTAIDGAVKAERDARTAAVAALTEQLTAAGSGSSAALNQAKQELTAAIQAEQSARSQADQQETAARTQADAVLTEKVDKAYADENPSCVVGYYIGEGKYGSSNPNVLTVGFPPKALFLFDSDYLIASAVRLHDGPDQVCVCEMAGRRSVLVRPQRGKSVRCQQKYYYYMILR